MKRLNALATVALFLFIVVSNTDSQWVSFCYAKVLAKNLRSISQVSCVSRVLMDGQNQVTTANCIACDKYFHCRAFKKAAQTCGSRAKIIALQFGDCRAADEHDPEDQVANNFGANGGNCEGRYLKICNNGNNCKWNPSNQSCSAANVFNPNNVICRGLPN